MIEDKPLFGLILSKVRKKSFSPEPPENKYYNYFMKNSFRLDIVKFLIRFRYFNGIIFIVNWLISYLLKHGYLTSSFIVFTV